MQQKDLLCTVNAYRVTEKTQFWRTDKDLNIKKIHK